MIRRRHLLGTGLAAVLAACGTADKEREPGGTASQPGMGMDGRMGGMMSGEMMDEMERHMQRMTGAGADSMQAMTPMHRQMTADMLSTMNREMRDMRMTADSAWSATMDSVRQDLLRMPELSAPEMRALMPAHRERVTRLMQMHRSMMADMKM